ncbi:hypothetical protein [Mycobacteroides abscessus]|uniref:hypothetical protein n=1 Tax=Mycobacteroides abscessus TaxID=36809 RepID=UPI0005DBFA31|nr:hypothetical protein [Mycobacteroides abscessus]CPW73199.1 Uncharacterised protein [Mycobacteroides abscessus]SKF61025.1 Uncharacterised protein [Mycobacteroides abscessus subsp. bolletii]SKH65671.1 Uncharacterised protein [Mycobacteroides abscessus subsp. bolletii]
MTSTSSCTDCHLETTKSGEKVKVNIKGHDAHRKEDGMQPECSTAYGTAHPLAVTSDPAPVNKLGDLLGLLVEGDPFLWSLTAQLGAAGYVTITYNLDPSTLEPDVRHDLLAMAAQLANRHQTTRS